MVEKMVRKMIEKVKLKHKRKTENKNESKRTNRIYSILQVALIFVFIASVSMLVHNRMLERRAQKQFEALAQEMIQEETETQTDETEEATDDLAASEIQIPDRQFDWDVLRAENEDIYAWIIVPETNIDYPVLQHETEDDYYLNHNLDGSIGYPGCIYTQTINSKDFTDPNTVLYGHNMKNGSMFQSLHNFEDDVFFDENKYFFIYTENAAFVYEIFAAYEYTSDHLLYLSDLTIPDNFQRYLDQIPTNRAANAHFRDEVEVSCDNHIVTLSTCVSGNHDKRYLVQGVLVNEPELE